MAVRTSVPPEYAEFVDDAAVFPPREAPLEEAVREHDELREAPYAALVGPFVVDDRRLPALVDLLERTPGRSPLPVTVVLTGGAGTVEPAVRRATGSSVTALRGVEVALRDLDDLAGNARRVATAVRAVQDQAPEAATYVEVPLVHVPDPTGSRDWLAALDEVAAADLRLKLRTGGLEGDAFPTTGTLAGAVDAALDRELSFKCTAGLHHAVRHRAADTGFEHHGFLNLLLATAAAWDGAGRDEVARLLGEHDSGSVAAAARDAGSALASVRRWFTSFGCCAVADPLGDLLALGLIGRVL